MWASNFGTVVPRFWSVSGFCLMSVSWSCRQREDRQKKNWYLFSPTSSNSCTNADHFVRKTTELLFGCGCAPDQVQRDAWWQVIWAARTLISLSPLTQSEVAANWFGLRWALQLWALSPCGLSQIRRSARLSLIQRCATLRKKIQTSDELLQAGGICRHWPIATGVPVGSIEQWCGYTFFFLRQVDAHIDLCGY
jgi:hypothetical protein